MGDAAPYLQELESLLHLREKPMLKTVKYCCKCTTKKESLTDELGFASIRMQDKRMDFVAIMAQGGWVWPVVGAAAGRSAQAEGFRGLREVQGHP